MVNVRVHKMAINYFQYYGDKNITKAIAGRYEPENLHTAFLSDMLILPQKN